MSAGVDPLERRGRRSLRADSRFCIIAGLGIALSSGLFDEPLGSPWWALVAAGAVTFGWGTWVGMLAESERWFGYVAWVMTANFVAGFGLAAFALLGRGIRLTVGGLLAVAVLGFAFQQMLIVFRGLGRIAGEEN